MMDRTYLICSPVAHGSTPIPSTTTFCNECGQSVWVSLPEYRPGTSEPFIPICFDCALQDMIVSEDDPVIAISDEQLDVVRSLGFDVDRDTVNEALQHRIKAGKELMHE